MSAATDIKDYLSQHPFRVIITGSRNWRDAGIMRERILRLELTTSHPNTCIVHGASPLGGADWIADDIADELGIRCERFPPDPRILPRTKALRMRNARMVKAGGDLLLAFPLADSRGTWDTYNLARAHGIAVEVVSR
jgi:hypothetical protein